MFESFNVPGLYIAVQVRPLCVLDLHLHYFQMFARQGSLLVNKVLQFKAVKVVFKPICHFQRLKLTVVHYWKQTATNKVRHSQKVGSN